MNSRRAVLYDGTHDDEHFVLIMREALKQYKDRLLPGHIDEPFTGLLDGLQRVIDQCQKLEVRRLPGKPERGPVFKVSASIFVSAPAKILMIHAVRKLC